MIRTIAVIGAGAMGHGIAESFAMHGYDVKLFDSSAAALTAAKPAIREELELLAEEGFIAGETIEATLERISLCSDLGEAVADRDYVIEAAPEKLELKQALLAELDGYSSPRRHLRQQYIDPSRLN